MGRAFYFGNQSDKSDINTFKELPSVEKINNSNKNFATNNIPRLLEKLAIVPIRINHNTLFTSAQGMMLKLSNL